MAPTAVKHKWFIYNVDLYLDSCSKKGLPLVRRLIVKFINLLYKLIGEVLAFFLKMLYQISYSHTLPPYPYL
jgi:hypothetical protein